MITRRHFIGTSSAAGFALSRAAGEEKQASANDKIQIALIGCGGMGQGDAKASTSLPGVKLIAAADVYDGRLTKMREMFGKDIFTGCWNEARKEHQKRMEKMFPNRGD